MAFTGKFGSSNSKFGNIEYGVVGEDDPLHQFVESTLSLTQDAVISNFLFEDVESTLAFTSDATGIIEIPLEAENELNLTQLLDSNFIFLGLGSSLNFQQTATGIVPVEIEIVHFIDFDSAAEPPIEEDAENTLALVSTAYNSYTADSTLVLVQTVAAGVSPGVLRETLALTQTLEYKADFALTPSNALNLNSSVTYSVESACVTKQYTPFVGSSGLDYLIWGQEPPPTTAPTLSRALLTLTYPFTGPSTTLALRNPDFGNTEGFNFNRINRETRGGDLRVYADPTWPKVHTLDFTVSHLSQTQADNILDFLLASVGKEIGLLDHENRQWKGIITNPDAEVSHVDRHNRSIQLQFEGERV